MKKITSVDALLQSLKEDLEEVKQRVRVRNTCVLEFDPEEKWPIAISAFYFHMPDGEKVRVETQETALVHPGVRIRIPAGQFQFDIDLDYIFSEGQTSLASFYYHVETKRSVELSLISEYLHNVPAGPQSVVRPSRWILSPAVWIIDIIDEIP